jgi:hypothetical protein
MLIAILLYGVPVPVRGSKIEGLAAIGYAQGHRF